MKSIKLMNMLIPLSIYHTMGNKYRDADINTYAYMTHIEDLYIIQNRDLYVWVK